MQIFSEDISNWNELEIKVAEIFSDCGFEVFQKKKLQTARGFVEVDVYATDNFAVPKNVYICECKFWNTKIPQEKIHAFNSLMQNSGANHGLIISKTGFQKGSVDAVKFTNIVLLTWNQFQEMFADLWIDNSLKRLGEYVKELSEYMDYYSIGFEKKFDLVNENKKKSYLDIVAKYEQIEILCLSNIQYSGVDFVENMENNKKLKSEYKCWYDYFNELYKLCDNGITEFKDFLDV